VSSGGGALKAGVLADTGAPPPLCSVISCPNCRVTSGSMRVCALESRGGENVGPTEAEAALGRLSEAWGCGVLLAIRTF
jgi:hypothetical protein